MRGTLERAGCPGCGYPNEPDDLACGMCGHVLGRSIPTIASPPPSPVEVRVEFDTADEPREPLRRTAVVLALGLVIAPAFAYLPLLSTMGWFFSALCHEIGHTLVAWLFGMPAFPAIRLDGHAASVHQPQKTFLVIAVWAGLAALAWRARGRRGCLVPLAVAVVLYPFLAWSNGREVLHLLGGHLGECAFAAVFLWRALDGGFSKSDAERVLYAALAGYLLGDNVALCARLMTSRAAIEEYRGNGSFGLTNDYLRLAEDLLHVPLGSVAFGMLLIVAATPLVTLAAWLLSTGPERRQI